MIVLARSFERRRTNLSPELKEDCFSHIAKEAFAAILRDQATIGGADVGMAFANSYGGWTFGQKQLEELAGRGPRHVSAFQATAWFPAAAQGQVTINYGLRIPARTFSTEGLCYYHALLHARRMLSGGYCSHMFVGSAEVFGSAWLRAALGLDHAEDCATWLLVGRDPADLDGADVRLSYAVDPMEANALAAELAQPVGSSCKLPFAIESVLLGEGPAELSGLSIWGREDAVFISPKFRSEP